MAPRPEVPGDREPLHSIRREEQGDGDSGGHEHGRQHQIGAERILVLDHQHAQSLAQPRPRPLRHDGRHEVADVAEDAGFYECDGPPANFVELILGKTKVNSAPGEAAMRGAELLDAAYRSVASGKAEPVRG